MSRVIKFRAWYPNENTGEMMEWGSFDLMNYLSNSPGRVMQFTGLLDKNGREIYEGDVVEACWDVIQPDIVDKRKHEVVYMDGAFQLDNITIADNFSYIDLEVIGNIYENPELLKV